MILCHLCPFCGQPPGIALSPEQVFCDNKDCSMISWNATKSLDDNLMNANVVKLPDWLTPPSD